MKGWLAAYLQERDRGFPASMSVCRRLASVEQVYRYDLLLDRPAWRWDVGHLRAALLSAAREECTAVQIPFKSDRSKEIVDHFEHLRKELRRDFDPNDYWVHLASTECSVRISLFQTRELRDGQKLHGERAA